MLYSAENCERMKVIKCIAPLLLAAALLTACNQKPETAEKTEIERMDSTEQVVKVETDKLEEQTKKVEASLEKLKKEFEENKK